MTTEPRYRKGDVVDIVFHRAVVTAVHDSGRLAIVHSDEEFAALWPNAKDVEVTVVGYEKPEEWL